MTSKQSSQSLLDYLHTQFLRMNSSWLQPRPTKILGGIIVGSGLISIPLLYSTVDSVQQLSTLQLGLIVLVIEVSALFSLKLGSRFVDEIARVLDNSGL